MLSKEVLSHKKYFKIQYNGKNWELHITVDGIGLDGKNNNIMVSRAGTLSNYMSLYA